MKSVTVISWLPQCFYIPNKKRWFTEEAIELLPEESVVLKGQKLLYKHQKFSSYTDLQAKLDIYFEETNLKFSKSNSNLLTINDIKTNNLTIQQKI